MPDPSGAGLRAVLNNILTLCVSPCRMANCRESWQWEVGQCLRLSFDPKNRSSPHDWRAKAGLKPPDHRGQVCFLPSITVCFLQWTRGKSEPGQLVWELLFPAICPSPVAPHPQWPYMRSMIINSISSFRISQPDSKEIRFLGSGVTKCEVSSATPQGSSGAGSDLPLRRIPMLPCYSSGARLVLTYFEPASLVLLFTLGVPCSSPGGSLSLDSVSCSCFVSSLILLEHILL